MIQIIRVSKSEELSAFCRLLEEYSALRGYDEALGDLNLEMARPSTIYPCITLARNGDAVVGCVAFRKIEKDCCEMKRLFVKPEFQGRGIGKSLVKRLILEASKEGYKKMKLDTHPWMKAADKLYQSLGFYEIARYNDNPTSGIRFMELVL